jgi:hypothetical protein
VGQLRIPLHAGKLQTPLGTISAANSLGNAAFSTIEVPLRQLDDFALPSVGFIKIDLEGHEEDVLLGAQSLIARDRPSLMVKVEERHNPGSIERVTGFFQSRGYCGFFFDGSALRSIEMLDLTFINLLAASPTSTTSSSVPPSSTSVRPAFPLPRVRLPADLIFWPEEFFQDSFPHERSDLSDWRKRLGDRLELLLAESLRVAHEAGALRTCDLERVTVDTTVWPKAISFPTDAKLLHAAMRGLNRPARKHGVGLRQSYSRIARAAAMMAGRYANAKQFKRHRRQLGILRSRLDRIIRDIRRKISHLERGG